MLAGVEPGQMPADLTSHYRYLSGPVLRARARARLLRAADRGADGPLPLARGRAGDRRAGPARRPGDGRRAIAGASHRARRRARAHPVADALAGAGRAPGREPGSPSRSPWRRRGRKRTSAPRSRARRRTGSWRMPTDAPAMPPKPRTASTRAATRKISAHLSMISLLCEPERSGAARLHRTRFFSGADQPLDGRGPCRCSGTAPAPSAPCRAGNAGRRRWRSARRDRASA